MELKQHAKKCKVSNFTQEPKSPVKRNNEPLNENISEIETDDIPDLPDSDDEAMEEEVDIRDMNDTNVMNDTNDVDDDTNDMDNSLSTKECQYCGDLVSIKSFAIHSGIVCYIIFKIRYLSTHN